MHALSLHLRNAESNSVLHISMALYMYLLCLCQVEGSPFSVHIHGDACWMADCKVQFYVHPSALQCRKLYELYHMVYQANVRVV